MSYRHENRLTALWAKINKSWPRWRGLPCWLWTGYLTTRGYGRTSWEGKLRLVHNLIYELQNGKIPAGLEPDHLCPRKNCCRPGHIEPVPHRKNVLRGRAPAAVNARKTHCKRGHQLSGDNLYDRGPHHRACRLCHRLRARLRREATA